jgi:hypothetical protein
MLVFLSVNEHNAKRFAWISCGFCKSGSDPAWHDVFARSCRAGDEETVKGIDI